MFPATYTPAENLDACVQQQRGCSPGLAQGSDCDTAGVPAQGNRPHPTVSQGLGVPIDVHPRSDGGFPRAPAPPLASRHLLVILQAVLFLRTGHRVLGDCKRLRATWPNPSFPCLGHLQARLLVPVQVQEPTVAPYCPKSSAHCNSHVQGPASASLSATCPQVALGLWKGATFMAL